MARNIRNEMDLKKVLETLATKIINNVSKKVLKLLQDNIKEYVYNSHGPNAIYLNNTKKPSMEFFKAFQWHDIEKNINGVCRELFYNWQEMTTDEGGYKHSSVSKNWPIDTRMQLADYLNVDGYDSSLWISVQRKPYWEITIEQLENGLLDQWFDEEAKKIGLNKI
jgi:hypothetical protein